MAVIRRHLGYALADLIDRPPCDTDMDQVIADRLAACLSSEDLDAITALMKKAVAVHQARVEVRLR